MYYYIIRKSWEDTKSQYKGAFRGKQRAINNCPEGYTVFKNDGEVIYTNKEKNIEVSKLEDKTEEKEEFVTFKNKVDIEKELFEEFNNIGEKDYSEEVRDTEKNMTEDKKLPGGSLDEYMKNFNENEFKENEISSLFSEDDLFPNIPI